jgi:hypothetical protein
MMSRSTNNWQRDLAKALEENQGKPVFEYSNTPQDTPTEIVKESKGHRRPRWRRAELMLLVAPLLFLCLVFASPALNNVRNWCAPPTKAWIAASNFGEPKTSAERIAQEKAVREERRAQVVAEQDYQRRLADWRLRFVVMPRVAIGLLLTGGIIFLGIKAWRQYFRHLMS